jgi:hypothetical protein
MAEVVSLARKDKRRPTTVSLPLGGRLPVCPPEFEPIAPMCRNRSISIMMALDGGVISAPCGRRRGPISDWPSTQARGGEAS